jgi:hypothetical protein
VRITPEVPDCRAHVRRAPVSGRRRRRLASRRATGRSVHRPSLFVRARTDRPHLGHRRLARFQRQGLGRAMLRAVCSSAKTVGAKKDRRAEQPRLTVSRSTADDTKRAFCFEPAKIRSGSEGLVAASATLQKSGAWCSFPEGGAALGHPYDRWPTGTTTGCCIIIAGESTTPSGRSRATTAGLPLVVGSPRALLARPTGGANFLREAPLKRIVGCLYRRSL